MNAGMKKHKNILFDLDGTLTDSGKGIMNSVKYALNHFNIETKDETELKRFVGPPLWDSFPKFYNFNEEETKLAVDKYREYLGEKGMFENKVYDGIEELLQELYKTDKKVFLATSKAEVFATKILKYFNLEKYFTYIGGATMDSSRSKKGQVIQHVIKKHNLKLEETIMIGDKAEDVIGANENSIDSIGVLYGYGDYEELSEAGATHIVKDVKELSTKLL